MNDYEYTIEIKNKTTATLKLIVEPWGNESDLAFDQTARIGFTGTKLQTIPVEHRPDALIIHGVEDLRPLGIWIDGYLVG